MQSNLPLMEITKDLCDISPEELRSFLKEAGVWVYCDRDAVIYANDRFLFLHTAEEGEYTLHLRNAERLVDALTGEPYIQGKHLKKGESFIFSFLEA